MTEQEYNREIEFIFNQFPSYQRVGKVAYKPGIETMQSLDALLGYPHKEFRTIHIAGTNGKGSTSHMLAAAYTRVPGITPGTPKIALYTSPHLVDFRERIKINGEMISKEYVYSFLKRYKEAFIQHGASFFEITTALAFKYFADEKVDLAIIECGLGGRLDSTNIINPHLSIITNIGLDHCEHLGYSLQEIAVEKGGIIKPGVPVIVGEKSSPEVAEYFVQRANQLKSPIIFAEDFIQENIGKEGFTGELYESLQNSDMDLTGDCQQKNIKTVVTALTHLNNIVEGEIPFLTDRVLYSVPGYTASIGAAAKITGLRGRWETIHKSPRVICDTGHNSHGFKILGPQINNTIKQQQVKHPEAKLKMIFGVVADKDLKSIISYLPKNAEYYFVNAKGTRALPASELAEQMISNGFKGISVEESPNGDSSIFKAIKQTIDSSTPDDIIFIGGSTFVVAEALEFFK